MPTKIEKYYLKIPVGYSESSPKKEIHSNSGLPQGTRKISNKQSNFTPKGTRKRGTTKAQSEQKEEDDKNQNGNK